ncbi:MAG: helicase-related protein [Candidatus Paceibacterota bacterium]
MDIREELVKAIKEEIVGPTKNPKYKDDSTDEELLLRYVHGTPKSRYGAGMLYPKATENIGESDTEENSEEVDPAENDSKKKSTTATGKAKGEDLDYEEPVGLANQFLPSAMGFTVRFRKNENSSLIRLNIESAFYKKGNGEKELKRVNQDGKIEVQTNAKGEPRVSDYWVRNNLGISPIELDVYSIFKEEKKEKKKILAENEDGKAWLSLNIYDRSVQYEDYITLTFVLVNEIKATGNRAEDDKHILYQNSLILNTDNDNLIAPYKERTRASDTDEEKELNLLYRKKRIFGIGHGVSVEWKSITEESSEAEKVNKIKTTVIPTYEMPQIAPSTYDHVDLSMYEFSDLGDWESAKKSLKNLASEYRKWIERISEKSKELEDSYQQASSNAIEKCNKSLKRIERGIDHLLESEVDSNLVKSFRWMNRAMLWQQQRSGTPQRLWKRTWDDGKPFDILEPIDATNNQVFDSLEIFKQSETWGKWRPFQIAFVLMNIESIINAESDEREIVDLIWFPTGGGKTEAYLGLSVFTIFYRRLLGAKELNEEGTTILMRYTLRLLTTQQYERAASLICACEYIRLEEEKKGNFNLGDEAISIGLWVGGTSTPNANKTIGKSTGALTQFNELNDYKSFKQAPYNFVVMKCPCCSAQIGKVSNAIPRDKLKVKGLRKEDGKNATIKFSCENINCEFYERDLPLYVIDEEIYSAAPTLLLGTVDKFAMLPWKPNSGKLFGFRERDGNRYRVKPPELIIQDELHLISGPLGSMVGMYETMVQTLCNDYGFSSPPFIKKDAEFIPPKIVASSATISRAKEQINALYGKNEEQLHIFPSQGIEFGNTWFSEEIEVTPDNPGRKYTGILASGYPSAQTAIVRSYSSVIQKVKEKEQSFDNIDYYWTLLGYFNSIRELGGAMSLVHGDIRERLYQIQNRELVPYANPVNSRRNIYKIQELTSRISSDKIPDTLKDLERKYEANKSKADQALDICLATNMVATGVDISRLGLMFIHGQPKTTAEYIQASSRVGRKSSEGPGLIFTLYSPSKPRDKSQYEQFQGYHSRIYSNVEPTSVTPFSINVRERALHAILIGLIRHFSSDTHSLLENPSTQNDEFKELKSIVTRILLQRCSTVNPEELDSTKDLCERRFYKWENTGYQSYGDAGNYAIKFNDVYPLMYANSAEVKRDVSDKSLATPTSMRGVDTESQIEITSL